MSSLVTRKLFTVADYLQMEKAGILREDDRIELVRGEFLRMSPTGPSHNAAVARATKALVHAVGDNAIVWIQNSAQLDDNTAPQPDVLLLKPREDFYASSLPRPQDILLVVEIAESSLAYDRKIKSQLYAEAQIPEYWISDIPSDRLLAFSDPRGKAYRILRQHASGERLAPQRLPGCQLAVDALLP